MIWTNLKQWLGATSRSQQGQDASRQRRQAALSLETLEDRLVPSTVYALAAGNHLISFDSAAPGAIISDVKITGIKHCQQLVGIDFRPADGQLYGATRTNLYQINTTTGVATQVGTNKLDPRLHGAQFGFDFNPVPDRLRLVSNKDHNLRLNPNDGTVVVPVDGNLAYAATDANVGKNPTVVASAYTNVDNVTATGTTLYGIDVKLNTLVIQNPPNEGVLNTVGTLGLNAKGFVSLDISSSRDATGAAISNEAFASFNHNRFYSINLTTGEATLVGKIGVHRLIIGIAIQPAPIPVGP